LQFCDSELVDATHAPDALHAYVVTLRDCVPLQLFDGMLQLPQFPVCVVSQVVPADSVQFCVSGVFCI